MVTQSKRFKAIKVILTFFGAGIFSGGCFGFIVSRASLRHLWFTRRAWWVFPTGKYWLAAVSSLIIALVVAYVASLGAGWLRSAKGPWHNKLIAFLLLSALAPALSWLSESAPAYGFILVPVIVAILLSLALFALTRVWDSRVATLILVACLMRTPLASIPDALMTGSMPAVWFDALRFLILLSLISGLAGYWLVRSETAN